MNLSESIGSKIKKSSFRRPNYQALTKSPNLHVTESIDFVEYGIADPINN